MATGLFFIMTAVGKGFSSGFESIVPWRLPPPRPTDMGLSSSDSLASAAVGQAMSSNLSAETR